VSEHDGRGSRAVGGLACATDFVRRMQRVGDSRSTISRRKTPTIMFPAARDMLTQLGELFYSVVNIFGVSINLRSEFSESKPDTTGWWGLPERDSFALDFTSRLASNTTFLAWRRLQITKDPFLS
jgi:hypothetical protein